MSGYKIETETDKAQKAKEELDDALLNVSDKGGLARLEQAQAAISNMLKNLNKEKTRILKAPNKTSAERRMHKKELEAIKRQTRILQPNLLDKARTQLSNLWGKIKDQASSGRRLSILSKSDPSDKPAEKPIDQSPTAEISNGYVAAPGVPPSLSQIHAGLAKPWSQPTPPAASQPAPRQEAPKISTLEGEDPAYVEGYREQRVRIAQEKRAAEAAKAPSQPAKTPSPAPAAPSPAPVIQAQAAPTASLPRPQAVASAISPPPLLSALSARQPSWITSSGSGSRPQTPDRVASRHQNPAQTYFVMDADQRPVKIVKNSDPKAPHRTGFNDQKLDKELPNLRPRGM